MTSKIFTLSLLCLMIMFYCVLDLNPGLSQAASTPAPQLPQRGDYFSSDSSERSPVPCDEANFPPERRGTRAYCNCVRENRIANENWKYSQTLMALGKIGCPADDQNSRLNCEAYAKDEEIKHKGQLAIFEAMCSGRDPFNGPDQFPTRTDNNSGTQPPRSCTYYVGRSRMQEALRAQPGVCERYGPDRIMCQAATSNPPQYDAGGSAPQNETWEAKLKRELQSEIENQATGPRFNHKVTNVRLTIDQNGAWRGDPSRTGSTDYVRLTYKIVADFAKSGRTVPPDGKRHAINVTLGGTQPAFSDPNSQTGGASCPPIPGQRLIGNVTVQQPIDRTPALTGETQTPGYPSYPQPTFSVTYGKLNWAPQGSQRRTYLPIWITVSDTLPLNVDQTAPLTPGEAGQYYSQFAGKLVQRWNPRTGKGGMFYITKLQRLDGSWEQVGRNVSLYPTAPQ